MPWNQTIVSIRRGTFQLFVCALRTWSPDCRNQSSFDSLGDDGFCKNLQLSYNMIKTPRSAFRANAFKNNAMDIGSLNATLPARISGLPRV